MAQRNEIKGFVSAHVHMLTTSFKEAPPVRGLVLLALELGMRDNGS
ncbi:MULTISPECIES: hypothetical protein [Enterobacter cloacae complex]|jgi:hypothetical protein|nr:MULTISPECIES: hypothetical protein [Enterobacter cloacae complex]MBF9770129.1 hypothetical protein [Enterobacter asburiae]MBS6013530.1 hypothetical protein [Enterobacter cloacae]MEB6114972.1 hypothetical protein [Enterobacter roggenkampii]